MPVVDPAIGLLPLSLPYLTLSSLPLLLKSNHGMVCENATVSALNCGPGSPVAKRFSCTLSKKSLLIVTVCQYSAVQCLAVFSRAYMSYAGGECSSSYRSGSATASCIWLVAIGHTPMMPQQCHLQTKYFVGKVYFVLYRCKVVRSAPELICIHRSIVI